MLTLSFDTSLDKTYIVLGEDKKIIESKEILSNEKNYHSAYLISMIAEILKRNNKTPEDVKVIGVNIGPGSFTGIRLGIAYAKGLAMGLNVPVVPVNAFELYLYDAPDAFVAIDSGRGDFFVAADGLAPQTMDIDTLESRQMDWPRTVGHKPFNLNSAIPVIRKKLADGNTEPVVPMYLRPSYAEQNKHAE